MISGAIDVELTPQGTLAERIRAGRGDNGVAAIRACCFFKRSIGNGSIVPPSEGANSKIRLEFAEMRAARFVTLCICIEGFGCAPDLIGYKGHHVGRRDFFRAKNATRKSQISKQHTEPQPICIAAPSQNQHQVIGREGVVPDDRHRVSRRIEQCRAGIEVKEFFEGSYVPTPASGSSNNGLIILWTPCNLWT